MDGESQESGAAQQGTLCECVRGGVAEARVK